MKANEKALKALDHVPKIDHSIRSLNLEFRHT